MTDDFGHWFAGLADGEGCFEVKRHGPSYICRFTINLRIDDMSTLEDIQKQIGVGTLYISKRTLGEDLVRWEVSKKGEVERLMDVFEKYPLRSKKRRDFDVWKQAVVAWMGMKR